MAEIKTPLTTAMKARAKKAVEELAGEDSEGKSLVNKSKQYTPRELRALILKADGTDATRTAMEKEGWFEPTHSSDWVAASNKAAAL